MNSELYDNQYRIPENILKRINAKMYVSNDSEGIKRAKNLVKSGYCTYQTLKRLKNFFDNFNPSIEPIEQFELAGGKDMRTFVDITLKKERDRVEHSKDITRDLNVNLNDPTTRAQTGSVNLKEGESEKLNKNALGIIFNDDMEVLLLKRSSYTEQWMPSKWALVGGGIEDGEEPVDSIEREIEEETGLDVNKFIEKFVIQRSEDNVEHIFVGKYDGDPDDVKLNKEHTDYEWRDVNNIEGELDIVPNLMDYVRLAIQKYE